MEFIPLVIREISLGPSIKHDWENAWSCYKWINKGINVIYKSVCLVIEKIIEALFGNVIPRPFFYSQFFLIENAFGKTIFRFHFSIPNNSKLKNGNSSKKRYSRYSILYYLRKIHLFYFVTIIHYIIINNY